jgi:hypothetical protein
MAKKEIKDSNEITISYDITRFITGLSYTGTANHNFIRSCFKESIRLYTIDFLSFNMEHDEDFEFKPY